MGVSNIQKQIISIVILVISLIVSSAAIDGYSPAVGHASTTGSSASVSPDTGQYVQSASDESQAASEQAAATPGVTAQALNLSYRWVYFSDNIWSQDNLMKAKDVMARAKKDGYNGFVLMNGAVESTSNISHSYYVNLADLKSYADSIGMGFYPIVLSVGTAHVMLSDNPDLVEGLPVKGALFVVQNGQATLKQDPAVSLPGGNFESATGNVFSGWDREDGPGTQMFADTSIVHSGKQSLRVQSSTAARIYTNVTVSPFRQYHMTLWVKTSGVSSPASLKPVIMGADGRQLWFNDFPINSTQDWTRFDLVFNSLNNNKIKVILGTLGTSGTFWVDDVSLEEIGLTNVVRRSEYPLVVKSLNGTVYTEGVDFYPVADPELGTMPSNGYYNPYHASPAIVLTPNSRIKEGQELRVSFYHAITSMNGGVVISLTNPDAVTIFQNQLKKVNDTIHPSGYFFYYDEIRAGNWETRSTPMTEGQLLATAFQREKRFINQIDPSAKIFVWNDMFDPNMNAVNNYCYCNGTVDGSYNGLTSDVIVVNWNGNSKNRIDSMNFFTGRGNQQILAGYYDGGYDIKSWLADARASNANVVGVMYTTWKSDYSQLDSFASAAWGGAAPSPGTVTSASTTLEPGWNLISIPVVPGDNRVADLFSPDVKSNIVVVWAWNSSRQAYTFYTPLPGYKSNLMTIDCRDGLWIYANKSMTFTINGTVPSSTSVSLDHGWNLVSNPTQQSIDPASSVYRNATVIWAYENGKYEFYTPLPGYTSTLTSLKPGLGYWVYH